MDASFFRDMLNGIAERGRKLIDTAVLGRRRAGEAAPAVEVLARALLSGRGEASGIALARQLLDQYEALTQTQRLAFFQMLANDFGPDHAAIATAWSAYDADTTPDHLRALVRAVEPPRQELFRRLNFAPGGTAALVAMRQDLLRHHLRSDPALKSVEYDLVHLLASWFNRGFLMMRRITWSSPADLLERIIRYEAVHRIRGWEELRSRIEPGDRRCYGFFHPSLPDEPLIFVEVALTRTIPGAIRELLAPDRQFLTAHEAQVAVFYSISNCQQGLHGISFGNFLIKQVVSDLRRDLPGLKRFATLSPAPGFAAWLDALRQDPAAQGLDSFDPALLEPLFSAGWRQNEALVELLTPTLQSLAAFYYLHAKNSKGLPLDPVARFHLGNGARLEQINILGDDSAKGLSEACGLMVNYVYDLDRIEANHEAYINKKIVCAAPAIRRMMPAARDEIREEIIV